MKAVQENSLPRYWPILYILNRVGGVLTNHFHLQKIIYLAQVEGCLPIKYYFFKSDYGPYSRTIKTDFLALSAMGYMRSEFRLDRWVFSITEKGQALVKEISALVSEEHRRRFDKIIEKASRLPFLTLKDYVYRKHLRSKVIYEKIKDDLIETCKFLLDNWSKFPLSSNRIFLAGAVDYCLNALKTERLSDPACQNHFVRAIGRFIDNLSQLYEQLYKEPDLLKRIPLDSLRDDFEFVQEVCDKYGVLPRLYDDNADIIHFARPAPAIPS